MNLNENLKTRRKQLAILAAVHHGRRSCCGRRYLVRAISAGKSSPRRLPHRT
jgi:hypothetical protein